MGPVRRFTPLIVSDISETATFYLTIDICAALARGEWVVIADEEFIVPFSGELSSTGLFDRIPFERLVRDFGGTEEGYRRRVLAAGKSSGLTIKCFDDGAQKAYEIVEEWLNADPIPVAA
jgi:hypothetical protein